VRRAKWKQWWYYDINYDECADPGHHHGGEILLKSAACGAQDGNNDDNMILTMMSVQALAIIMVEKFFSKVPRVAHKMEIMMIIWY
jgi:hypothetical protein